MPWLVLAGDKRPATAGGGGGTDCEIGQALSIECRTVSIYVDSILAKFRMASRSAAPAYAVRNGLA